MTRSGSLADERARLVGRHVDLDLGRIGRVVRVQLYFERWATYVLAFGVFVRADGTDGPPFEVRADELQRVLSFPDLSC